MDNPDNQITWSTSGQSDLSVSISASRVATINIPDADWFGSETIEFIATDPGLLSDSYTATFTVQPVNDAPIVDEIPDQTIDEGENFADINLNDLFRMLIILTLKLHGPIQQLQRLTNFPFQ